MTTEQLFADRYRLDRRLGVGGMATVQLAFDTRLERNVAVKLLAEHLAEDSSFVSRFRREALAAARLVHPNIVQVFDFGSDVPLGPPVHRHGVRRRPLVRRAAARPRADDPARRRRDPHPGLPRARLRAPQRRRAPRRQARQPDGQHRRRGQAGRLRHRQGGRAVGHHEGRLGARHRRLPVARAGARRARRPGLGPVRARRRLLPADGRQAALRGGLADRSRAPAGGRRRRRAWPTTCATSRRRWPPRSPARWRAIPSAATPTPPRWRTRCATASPASRTPRTSTPRARCPTTRRRGCSPPAPATGRAGRCSRSTRTRRAAHRGPPAPRPPPARRRSARSPAAPASGSRCCSCSPLIAGGVVAYQAINGASAKTVELNEDVGGNVDDAVQSFKDLVEQQHALALDRRSGCAGQPASSTSGCVRRSGS